MPNSYPRVWIFNLHLTTIKDFDGLNIIYPVCPDLSVQIFRVIMVINNNLSTVSGSLLVSAAHFGGYVMGTDIDYLLLHAKGWDT